MGPNENGFSLASGSLNQEREPLVDTSVGIHNTPRKATNQEFIPVGHTALEAITPDDAKKLSLPPSAVWIKHLYLSWCDHTPTRMQACHIIILINTEYRALHGRGIGRSAMAVSEQTAASPPLNATVIALDTLRKEVQLTEAHLRKLYDERGMARPKVFVSNEEWYVRQGYIPMPGPEYFEWADPTTGEVENVPIIFLKKGLA